MRLVFVLCEILLEKSVIAGKDASSAGNLTGGQICSGRFFMQYEQLSTKQVEYLVLNTSALPLHYTLCVA